MYKIFNVITLLILSCSFSIMCMEKDITLTVTYNNVPFNKGLDPDWGLSIFVEGLEKNILFDTGKLGSVLLYNLEKLNIDPASFEIIVISHYHFDHVGGLETLLEKNSKVHVYALASFPKYLKNELKSKAGKFVAVKKPHKICKNVWSTGELGDSIKEQSIIIGSSEGLIVITGCAHPGIVEIVKFIKNHFREDIYLVIGGFHLMPYNDNRVRGIIGQLKGLGVKKVAPSHCTGKRQIELIREAWGKDFVESGCGAKIKIPVEISEKSRI